MRVAALTALGRACVRDRGLRLPLLAVAHGSVALALATVVPMWTLLVGPLVLGVPHLVADLRYLVFERPRGLTRAQVAAIALPLVAMTGLSMLAPASALVLTVPGLVAIGGAIALSRAGAVRRAVLFGLVALAAIPLCANAPMTLLWLAHAHNAVAVALWLALSPKTPLRWVAAVILLAGGVAIGSGALDFVPLATGGWITPAAGFDPVSIGESLALPGLTAARSLMLYAYAQAIHYTVWLRLIPGERSASEVPVSFRRGLDGLRAALGRPAFVIAVVLAVVIPLAGLVWAAQTRALYLEIAGFHAWLELAVGAHLVLAFRR